MKTETHIDGRWQYVFTYSLSPRIASVTCVWLDVIPPTFDDFVTARGAVQARWPDADVDLWRVPLPDVILGGVCEWLTAQTVTV